MKGDFTRMTFNKDKRFSCVLMQQGRVQLDADWNEQAAILLHFLRALAADLIGPHGGPGDSFAIKELTEDDEAISNNFAIGQGHYYVDGILCENDQNVTFQSQPDYPLALDLDLEKDENLVYLDVWERHISYLEDEDERGDEPSIREVALGGPDTATRAKIVWQVKVLPMDSSCLDAIREDGATLSTSEEINRLWHAIIPACLQPADRGQMQARAKLPEDADLVEPCIIDPEARYRGAENQLYRVEIHQGGPPGEATFKWSRENGSVVFPITRIQDELITLEHLGRDERFGLRAGDWVEVVDDDSVLLHWDLEPVEPLRKVIRIDPDSYQVTLDSGPDSEVGQTPSKHPLLRRWDHKADAPTSQLYEMDGGTIILEQGEDWIPLEDGVEIRFRPPDAGPAANGYQAGDYWLIPARTATGDVEWPGSIDEPAALPPHGIEHHYAPLAIITVNVDGEITNLVECRREFTALAQPV